MPSLYDSPSGSEDRPPQPRQIPDVATPPYARVVADAWMVEGMMQVQKTLGELTSSVKSLEFALTSKGQNSTALAIFFSPQV